MPRFMPDDWTLPAIEPRTEAFFTSGRMLLQHCTACDAIQHPPEDVCYSCQGMEFDSREVSNLGTVYSFTVIPHAIVPQLAERVPYTVLLVSLDEAPHVRVVGNYLGNDPDDVQIGMAVRAVWEEIDDPVSGRTLRLPQWERAPG